MRILALDTATTACSVAVWDQDHVAAQSFQAMPRGQAQAILPMVAETLSAAACDKPDLIAVTVGPGAFTGIRIGLAAARGLGLAWGVPVVGIPTTLALAAAIPPAQRQGHRILVVIDSKREDQWVQMFDDTLAELTPPHGLLPGQIQALKDSDVLVLDDPGVHIDAAQVAQLAAQGVAVPPQPLYLRPADVTMPQAS